MKCWETIVNGVNVRDARAIVTEACNNKIEIFKTLSSIYFKNYNGGGFLCF